MSYPPPQQQYGYPPQQQPYGGQQRPPQQQQQPQYYAPPQQPNGGYPPQQPQPPQPYGQQPQQMMYGQQPPVPQYGYPQQQQQPYGGYPPQQQPQQMMYGQPPSAPQQHQQRPPQQPQPQQPQQMMYGQPPSAPQQSQYGHPLSPQQQPQPQQPQQMMYGQPPSAPQQPQQKPPQQSQQQYSRFRSAQTSAAATHVQHFVPSGPTQPHQLQQHRAAGGVAAGQSNIALFGTDVEKKVRQASGGREPAWDTAGKAPGLQIWRIEQFKVVPVDPRSYGAFYSGDSYIVLNTTLRGGRALAWDVHFWLGSETTQDESGTAAYKTVELDDFLGGAPVQHREVQDHESQLFLSYFPQGLRIMEGGMQSGFRHVEAKAYKPRLLQLKGKRNVRLRQVPLAIGSVNSGDVFVLDLGTSLIQFNGAQSSPQERAKASEICRAISSERGSARITVFEERDTDWPQEWLSVLGRGPIKSAAEGGDDAAFESTPTRRMMYRLSDASGSLQVSFVARDADVQLSKLDPADAFIVDVGNEVFAWIGQGTSAQERSQGLNYAQMYVRDTGLDPATPITRVMGGHEGDYFLQLFR